MSGKMKTMAMILVGILVGSTTPALASEAQDRFTTVPNPPAYMTGTQVGGKEANFFSTKWNEDADFGCEYAAYASTGTVANGAEEIALHPEYSECEALGNSAAIDTEGCDFVLGGDTYEALDTEEEATGDLATFSLACEEGKDIRVTGAFGAEITIEPEGNQELLGVAYENEGAPGDVAVAIAIDGLHYSANFVAQLGGVTAEDDDGFMTGEIAIEGYSDAEHESRVGVAVEPASEAQDRFTTVPNPPAYMTGTQVGGKEANFFSTKWDEDATFSCELAAYASTGTVANGAEEIALHPEYSECEALGNSAAIDTEGCDFVLDGDTYEALDTEEEPAGDLATFSLACEEGKDIRVTGAFGAEITIEPEGNQELLGVAYENEGAPGDVAVAIAIDGLHYSANFVAQLGGVTAEDDDGFMTGEIAIEGYSDAEHESRVGVKVEAVTGG